MKEFFGDDFDSKVIGESLKQLEATQRFYKSKSEINPTPPAK